MRVQPSSTHLDVISNLYDFLSSVQHKRGYDEKFSLSTQLKSDGCLWLLIYACLLITSNILHFSPSLKQEQRLVNLNHVLLLQKEGSAGKGCFFPAEKRSSTDFPEQTTDEQITSGKLYLFSSCFQAASVSVTGNTETVIAAAVRTCYCVIEIVFCSFSILFRVKE